MTVRTPPIFLQAGAHTAEDTRLALQGFFGSATGSFTGGVSASDPGHGVVRAGSTQLAVTANGTPNMSVNVAAGAAFIRGTEAAAQGSYGFFNDATENLAIDAADPTNGRRDLIVAQVRDAGYSGSDNDARLFVVKGTAAGSPADPAVPANCLVLARVVVGAGVSSITSGNITDLRTYTRPWNTAWGVVATGQDTSERTNRSTSADINSAVSKTFTVPAGRRLKITGIVAGEQNTSTGIQRLFIYKNSSQLEIVARQSASTTLDMTTLNGVALDTPAAGSVTYSLRMDTTAGTVDARGDLVPTTIIIEDVGPA